MSNKHTVEVTEGERLTAFHIKPPVTLGKLVGLPNPRFFGAEGPETVDALGLYDEKDGASVVAFASHNFGSQGIEAIDYAAQIADHLGALATDQTPPATA